MCCYRQQLGNWVLSALEPHVEYLNKPAVILLEMQNLFEHIFFINWFLFYRNWSNSLKLFCPAGYARVIHSLIGFLLVKLCHCISVLDVRGAKNKNSLSGLFLWFHPCWSCWWGLQLSKWKKDLSRCGSGKGWDRSDGSWCPRVVWEGLAGFPIRARIWNLL